MDKRETKSPRVQSANIAKLSNEGIPLWGARNRKPVPGTKDPRFYRGDGQHTPVRALSVKAGLFFCHRVTVDIHPAGDLQIKKGGGIGGKEVGRHQATRLRSPNQALQLGSPSPGGKIKLHIMMDSWRVRPVVKMRLWFGRINQLMILAGESLHELKGPYVPGLNDLSVIP